VTHRLSQTLDCDRSPTCNASFRLHHGERLNEARERARRAGWGIDRTTLKNRTIVRDFCPAHVKEK
jgi:hypothetical protein